MTHFLLLTGVGVPVVLLGSWLFSLAFEKPFLSHRSFADWHALLTRRRPGPDTAAPDAVVVTADGASPVRVPTDARTLDR